MKDKSNLNHNGWNIACVFSRCSFLVIVNIATGRLLKLRIRKLFQPDNSYVFSIRKKIKSKKQALASVRIWRGPCFGMLGIWHLLYIVCALVRFRANRYGYTRSRQFCHTKAEKTIVFEVCSWYHIYVKRQNCLWLWSFVLWEYELCWTMRGIGV